MRRDTAGADRSSLRRATLNEIFADHIENADTGHVPETHSHPDGTGSWPPRGSGDEEYRLEFAPNHCNNKLLVTSGCITMEALAINLMPHDLPLSEIYLDPNNPRFGEIDTPFVPDDDTTFEHHQAKAAARLMNDFAADKLKMNMEVNGFLPIDRVIVRKLAENAYVVLEGNRRIAAAKSIKNYDDQGNTLTESVLHTFKSIPCLIYTGSDGNAAWIFQGLRHITGINDWSSYNKARLLVEQMEEEGLTLTNVGKRFGLTAYGAGQWARGYYAYKQAKEETDYLREIDERIYPYFQELFGRSSAKLKEWLEWDESARKFKRLDNLNEYVGWFYPRPEATTDDDLMATGDQPLGNWERRHIGKRDDMRQLATLIVESPKYFQSFRENKDLEKAYSAALVDQFEAENKKNRDAEAALFMAIQSCVSAIENTPISVVKDSSKKARLDEEIERLENAIALVK